jgi:hypothetical protein
MKNIHVIPTDKPSRLQRFTDVDKIEFELASKDEIFNKGINIYITSSEEIKDYWFLNTLTNEIGFTKDSIGIQKNAKKIILTTDQDLIKDGVQAIDDEFLEWFVKNPSCEEVDFEVVDDNIQWYKIINPKNNFYCGDEVDYGDKCSEQCDGCVNSTGVDYGYLPKKHVEFIKCT